MNTKVFLLLLAVSAIAVLPFLQGQFIKTYDLVAAPLRAFELNSCLKDGVLYPRWSPDLFGGRGAPLFNFYAPFAYYLVQPFVFAGFGFATSVELVFALSIFASAIGAFLFCRKFAGVKGAFVGAVFYSFLPYHLHDIFVRGSFSESIAFAMIPFVALLLLETLEGRKILSGAASSALLILTHAPLALLFFFVFTPYLTAKAFFEKKKWLFVLSIALALGLSSFYWLPALAEKSQVHLELTLFDISGSFFSFENFVGKPFFNTEVSFGILFLLVVAAGLIVGGRKFKLEALGLAAVLVFLTPLSSWFWSLPLFNNVQFVWRLLPVAGLFSVPFVAAFFDKKNNAFIAASCLILIAYAVFSIQPVQYFSPLVSGAPLSLSELDKTINRNLVLALNQDLSYHGEYLPAGADYDSLLNGTRVGSGTAAVLSSSCYEQRLSINATSRTAVVLNLFYYPNWKASVDGHDAVLQNGGGGLAFFEVEKGVHAARVYFQETPIQLVSWLISIIFLIAVLVFAAKKRSWLGGKSRT